jgi:hypothetical protein
MCLLHPSLRTWILKFHLIQYVFICLSNSLVSIGPEDCICSLHLYESVLLAQISYKYTSSYLKLNCALCKDWNTIWLFIWNSHKVLIKFYSFTDCVVLNNTSKPYVPVHKRKNITAHSFSTESRNSLFQGNNYYLALNLKLRQWFRIKMFLLTPLSVKK